MSETLGSHKSSLVGRVDQATATAQTFGKVDFSVLSERTYKNQVSPNVTNIDDIVIF